MNWTTILVAVITALGALLGTYLSNRKSAALMLYRVEQLEKKVDKHNQVIERTYALEKKTAVLEQELKDLEKGA